jgi:hypothetical protein
MTDSIPRQDDVKQGDVEKDALNGELDAALAKFTKAEPRAGLEERILENLRIERKRAAERSWWRWPAVASLAALILVALFVSWRSGKSPQKMAAQHPPATTRTSEHDGTQVANSSEHDSTPPHELFGSRPKPHAITHTAAAVAPAPKLDEFPSPQPLSEQEKILAHYVTNYPAHAALIAQARADELRRDSAEEMGEAVSGSNENSQQRDQ